MITQRNKFKIYISGKISGLPQAEVEAKFNKAVEFINNSGFIAINPLDYQIDGYSYEELTTNAEAYEEQMKKDLEVLKNCDMIYMLTDWKDSKGAIREREFALRNEIPILLESVCSFLP